MAFISSILFSFYFLIPGEQEFAGELELEAVFETKEAKSDIDSWKNCIETQIPVLALLENQFC